MKIGISFHPYGCGYARFGKMKFSKMAQHGFLNADYNMADTEMAWYAMDERSQKQTMLEQKAEADSFGIKISQVHAPWRYPPRDAEVEDRRERMEKMKASILGARYLGCRYWVVHPIMPCGTHDLETGDAQRT